MVSFPQGYMQIFARRRHAERGGVERRMLQQLHRCLKFRTVASIGLQAVPDLHQTENEEW